MQGKTNKTYKVFPGNTYSENMLVVREKLAQAVYLLAGIEIEPEYVIEKLNDPGIAIVDSDKAEKFKAIRLILNAIKELQKGEVI